MAIWAPLRKLSRQHEEFVLNVVARPHNATQAYIDAGYSKNGAKQSASRLLKDPLVAARVKALVEAKHKALHMDVDEILARAAMLARIDVRALFNDDGTLRALHELEEEQAIAIAGVEVTEIVSGEGDKRRVTGATKKVRLRDPMSALRLLAEHKKLVKNSDDGVNALASAIADRLKAARERRRNKEQPK